jgi:hypothetical protein
MRSAALPCHPWVAAGQDHGRFGITAAAQPDWSATRDFVLTVEGLGCDVSQARRRQRTLHGTTRCAMHQHRVDASMRRGGH